MLICGVDINMERRSAPSGILEDKEWVNVGGMYWGCLILARSLMLRSATFFPSSNLAYAFSSN